MPSAWRYYLRLRALARVGCSVPVRHHLIGPIRPLRGHIAFHRIAALRDAFAVRERLGEPASGSELSLHIPSWHAVLIRPRGVQHRYVPELRCRHGLRAFDHRLALPKLPQSVPRGFPISWLHGSFRYGLPGCSPPCTDQTGSPAFGTFYFQASTARSPSPSAGYN